MKEIPDRRAVSDFRDIFKDTFAVTYNYFFLQHSVNLHAVFFWNSWKSKPNIAIFWSTAKIQRKLKSQKFSRLWELQDTNCKKDWRKEPNF